MGSPKLARREVRLATEPSFRRRCQTVFVKRQRPDKCQAAEKQRFSAMNCAEKFWDDTGPTERQAGFGFLYAAASSCSLGEFAR
jgi:hypothetical protein